MIVALVVGTVAGALLVEHARVMAAGLPALLTGAVVVAARLWRSGH